MTRQVTDVAASVRRRLLNLARERSASLDQHLVYYAIERFLYRLSLTPWAERLVVKGATLLRVWDVPYARPTRDIDFVGRVPACADLRRLSLFPSGRHRATLRPCSTRPRDVDRFRRFS